MSLDGGRAPEDPEGTHVNMRDMQRGTLQLGLPSAGPTKHQTQQHEILKKLLPISSFGKMILFRMRKGKSMNEAVESY